MRSRLSVTSVRRAAGALVALALMLGCAFVVSACGSSSAASGTSTAAIAGATGASGPAGATGAASSAGLTAYRNCLQSHGVTLPQGGAGGFFARGATGARGPSGGGGFFRRGATGAQGATGVRGPSGAGGFFRRGGSGPTGARGVRGTLTAAQQKALSACASLRPAGAAAGLGGGGVFNSSNPATAKFVACLKQHGIQTGSTADRTSTTFQAALAACRSLLPAGAGGFFGGGGAGAAPGSGSIGGGAPAGGAASGSTSADFAKFQACLKKHGVQPGAASQSQSATSAALAACRTLLPNNGNGSTTTTSTG